MPDGLLSGDLVDQAIDGGYINGVHFYTRDLIFAIRTYLEAYVGFFKQFFNTEQPFSNIDVAISYLVRSLGGKLVHIPGMYSLSVLFSALGYLKWPLVSTTAHVDESVFQNMRSCHLCLRAAATNGCIMHWRFDITKIWTNCLGRAFEGSSAYEKYNIFNCSRSSRLLMPTNYMHFIFTRRKGFVESWSCIHKNVFEVIIYIGYLNLCNYFPTPHYYFHFFLVFYNEPVYNTKENKKTQYKYDWNK